MPGIPCGTNCGITHRKESAAARCRNTHSQTQRTGSGAGRYTNPAIPGIETIGGRTWETSEIEQSERWVETVKTVTDLYQAELAAEHERRDENGPSHDRYQKRMGQLQQANGLEYPEDVAVKLDTGWLAETSTTKVLPLEDLCTDAYTSLIPNMRLPVTDRARWQGPGVAFRRLPLAEQKAFMAGQTHFEVASTVGQDTNPDLAAYRAYIPVEHRAAYDAGWQAGADRKYVADRPTLDREDSVIMETPNGGPVRVVSVGSYRPLGHAQDAALPEGRRRGWIVAPDGQTSDQTYIEFSVDQVVAVDRGQPVFG